MNNENTFQTITDDTLIELIEGAKDRLVFVAPGVRKKVAEALVRAAKRLNGKGAVNYILDVDAEVCRLGYGELDGLKLLQNVPGMNGGILNSQPGVRIGIVIADDDTLFYAPTPLLIEAEPVEAKKADEHQSQALADKPKPVQRPNGVLIRKSVPPTVAAACSADGNYSNREIGLDPVNARDVEKADDSLRKAPPKKFDLARQERVFSSKLCFMELEITGYQISAKKLELDPELFVADDDTRKRLSNRFRVFDKDRMPHDVKYKTADGNETTISMEKIEKQIQELRKDFLINVGRWGTVILRSRMDDFKARVEEIVAMLNFYKEKVNDQVKELAVGACRKLAEEVSAKLLANPPARLRNRLAMKSSREDKIEIIAEYIAESCEKEIESALASFNPKTKMVEKDVTYATFSDKEFIELLEKGLGKGCMKEILEEHDAARAVEDE